VLRVEARGREEDGPCRRRKGVSALGLVTAPPEAKKGEGEAEAVQRLLKVPMPMARRAWQSIMKRTLRVQIRRRGSLGFSLGGRSAVGGEAGGFLAVPS
jgi:hypothetical protein